MNQLHKVQPVSDFTPIPKTRNRHLTPDYQRAKPRKHSAPPVPSSQPVPKSDFEEQKGTDTEGRGEKADEGYITVPIAYKYVQVNPLKSKPSSLFRLSGGTRTPSLDSESPLNGDAPKRDSLYFYSPKPRHRQSTLSTLASQTLKKPFESNLTLCDEGEIPRSERHLADDMAASTKARALLVAEKGGGTIERLAVEVPGSYPLLDLSKKGLGDDDLQQVLRLLEVYPYATGLDLYGNKLKFSPCYDIFFGNSHEHIRKLTLSGNPLSNLPVHTVLGQFISLFSSLETLEMADCGLTDEDFFRIYASILSSSKLQSLQLRGNFVSDKSVLLIRQICTINRSIRSIDLRKTPFRGKHTRFSSVKVLTERSRKCCKSCILQ